MDFRQLDDIFELLGQNESLHGKRTVVFCLSLSPPQRLPLGIPVVVNFLSQVIFLFLLLKRH